MRKLFQYVLQSSFHAGYAFALMVVVLSASNWVLAGQASCLRPPIRSLPCTWSL
jgi:hypothetical protein